MKVRFGAAASDDGASRATGPSLQGACLAAQRLQRGPQGAFKPGLIGPATTHIVRRPALHHGVAGAHRDDHVARLRKVATTGRHLPASQPDWPQGGVRMSAQHDVRDGKKATKRACALAAAALGAAWLMGLTGAVPQAWAASTSSVTSRAGRSGILTQLAPGLAALVAAAIAIVAGGVIVSRRRPKGTLVVWLGSRWRCLAPVEVHEPLELADIFPAAACPDGWAVCWYRRAPLMGGPQGPAVRLAPGRTTTVEAAPPVTFTWVPGGFGADEAIWGEPPGSPFGVATDPMPTSERA
jgi:hypothetical protein